MSVFRGSRGRPTQRRLVSPGGGRESSFTQGIAPVLTVPGMAVNAGLFCEALAAKRHASVCCCCLLDFGDDMVAIHGERVSTGGNRGSCREIGYEQAMRDGAAS